MSTRQARVLLALAAGAFAAAILIAASAPVIEVRFTDVTAQAGIHFTHNAGR
jgi:hypothetical protein